MNTFIDITNQIIEQKLVSTKKIILSRIEYSVRCELFKVKVIFYTPEALEKKGFDYSFCPGGGVGFSKESKELLRLDFISFINKNFK